ncbi:MAG: hypothetical protein KGJ75_03390 [Alphaproteobacteria bacterium]|nr:hypothetical protein [Alphaproteobacteria bacterium]
MVADRHPAHKPETSRHKLSHELLHGLTPQEFDEEAKALAAAEAMTAPVRARLKAQLVERLKTSVDAPSWGPDWVRYGERDAPKHPRRRTGLYALLPSRAKADDDAPPPPLDEAELDDAHVIVRNLEKSRQVHHYRWLYGLGAVVAIAIALLAMFVDYQIIRGDVWTRALANQFMVVPAALQSSVMFKSLQVLFAVLIVHFMLKITGRLGRNALITAAFVMAMVMIVSLGYLVAYNNMAGATSATYENTQEATAPAADPIDRLFASLSARKVQVVAPAALAEEISLPLPRLSRASLANADSWIWFAFASMIFFIVTAVAALYMQIMESNIRNLAITRDYEHRRRQLTQLHMLELADKPA